MIDLQGFLNLPHRLFGRTICSLIVIEMPLILVIADIPLHVNNLLQQADITPLQHIISLDVVPRLLPDLFFKLFAEGVSPLTLRFHLTA